MQVDQNVLQIALAEALTKSVPPEMQKEIFSRAMYEYLFAPKRGTDKSPVSEAFQRALDEATREIAKQVINEPENLKLIKETIRQGLVGSLENKVLLDKIVTRITNAIW